MYLYNVYVHVCTLLWVIVIQVPVGVITKNETNREELMAIMEELQKKYTHLQGTYVHVYQLKFILLGASMT